MSYKIAIASSDGEHVDIGFGAAESYQIFTVGADGQIEHVEHRQSGRPKNDRAAEECRTQVGNGCTGLDYDGEGARIRLLQDCRCVLAGKIGTKAEKMLSRASISPFEVRGEISQLLLKLIAYYGEQDRRKKAF